MFTCVSVGLNLSWCVYGGQRITRDVGSPPLPCLEQGPLMLSVMYTRLADLWTSTSFSDSTWHVAVGVLRIHMHATIMSEIQTQVLRFIWQVIYPGVNSPAGRTTFDSIPNIVAFTFSGAKLWSNCLKIYFLKLMCLLVFFFLLLGCYFIPTSYLHSCTTPQVSPWCSCEHDSQ